MNKEQIIEWCKENGFILIDVSKTHLSKDEAGKIASAACGIEPLYIERKTKREEYAFARYLAMNYMSKFYSYRTVGEMYGLNRTMAYKAITFIQTELKYLKKWQQSAIEHFNDMVNKAEQIS